MGDESERLNRLEQDFSYMREAIDSVQKNIEQILDKLDNRYPTKEAIEWQTKLLEARIGAAEIQLAELRKDYDETEKSNVRQHDEFKKFMWRLMILVYKVCVKKFRCLV